MNEIFKKIDEVAHLVNETVEKDPKMVSIIIATPDAEDSNGHTLSGMVGTGMNIIETLANAFRTDGKLLEFVKDAVALVEGKRIMASLMRAKFADSIKEQPTTDACGKGEEMGACDGDNCEHCRCDEERGPEVEE